MLRPQNEYINNHQLEIEDLSILWGEDLSPSMNTRVSVGYYNLLVR